MIWTFAASSPARTSAKALLRAAVLFSSVNTFLASGLLDKEADHCSAQEQSYCTARGQGSSSIANMSRTVDQKVLSVEQDEGMGARVRRSIGRREVTVVFFLSGKKKKQKTKKPKKKMKKKLSTCVLLFMSKIFPGIPVIHY
jgi:hypothetical protein